MQIQPTQTLSFGYNNPLKTLFKKGKLPGVKTGFYGGELTKDTVSLEHIKPHSKGGKTELSNLVLTTKENNQKRGNRPLKEFFNKEAAEEYFKAFEKIKTKYFDGEKYVQKIKQTIEEILSKEV